VLSYIPVAKNSIINAAASTFYLRFGALARMKIMLRHACARRRGNGAAHHFAIFACTRAAASNICVATCMPHRRTRTLPHKAWRSSWCDLHVLA